MPMREKHSVLNPARPPQLERSTRSTVVKPSRLYNGQRTKMLVTNRRAPASTAGTPPGEITPSFCDIADEREAKHEADDLIDGTDVAAHVCSLPIDRNREPPPQWSWQTSSGSRPIAVAWRTRRLVPAGPVYRPAASAIRISSDM